MAIFLITMLIVVITDRIMVMRCDRKERADRLPSCRDRVDATITKIARAHAWLRLPVLWVCALCGVS